MTGILCERCRAVASRRVCPDVCTCPDVQAEDARFEFNLNAKPYYEDGRWWIEWMPAPGELRPEVYQIWVIERHCWGDGLFAGMAFSEVRLSKPGSRFRKPWIIDPSF